MRVIRNQKVLLTVTKDKNGDIAISFNDNLTDDDLYDFNKIMTSMCEYITQEGVRRHGLK